MRSLDLLVEAAHVVEQLEDEVEAHLLDRRLGLHLGQERLGVRNVHFLGNSTRRELGKERVQPTDHPRPLPPEITVALGQQPQDLAVIGRFNRSQSRCPQRSDGDRVGIVGVVLVGASRGQHPDPGSQGGRDVEHLLAPGHELLGQQVAQPTH